MKFSIKTTGLALAATLAFSLATSAQQQSDTGGNSAATPQAQERFGWKRGERMQGKHHRHGKHGRRAFARLNLTDAQKEQMRSIAAQQKQATRAVREELFRLREAQQPGVEPSAETKARFQELRGQLRTAREQTHTQMLTILTAEQRTQLEQMKQQHEQRRAERRSRFGGNGQTN